jgi:hypothetical protein
MKTPVQWIAAVTHEQLNQPLGAPALRTGGHSPRKTSRITFVPHVTSHSLSHSMATLSLHNKAALNQFSLIS